MDHTVGSSPRLLLKHSPVSGIQRILLELEGPHRKHLLLPAHFRDGETEAWETPPQGGRMRDAFIQLCLYWLSDSIWRFPNELLRRLSIALLSYNDPIVERFSNPANCIWGYSSWVTSW